MLGKWRDFHGELWGENLLRNALSLENFEARIIMGKYRFDGNVVGWARYEKLPFGEYFGLPGDSILILSGLKSLDFSPLFLVAL